MKTLLKNFFIISLLTLLCTLSANAHAGCDKIDSTLRFLRTLKNENADVAPFSAASLLKKSYASVSIRFKHELTQQETAELEFLGVRFKRMADGEIIRFGSIYGARMPWDVIDDIAALNIVERIESTHFMAAQRPLDVSVPDIHADTLWQENDVNGQPITGQGIVIADFDTGIDVFHPLFWNADGEAYAWIDANGNGNFDDGVDGVDINSNGAKDEDETLRFIDANIWDNYLNNTKEMGFQADVDWLYVDTNSNGIRDYGTDSGFTEADPTYGEQIFVVQDDDKNGRLDAGESLVALKTSKVIATMNINSVERKRGNDLISTDQDDNGHGTSVSGILCGGTPGIQRFTGVAPKAELLVSNIYWSAPSDVEQEIDWTDYISWAEQLGARVMLHEIGVWVMQFLDGSSNLESTMDIESEKGIVQVVPAGNLGNSGRLAKSDIAAGQSRELPFKIPLLPGRIHYIFASIHWRDSAITPLFSLRTPFGVYRNLSGDEKMVRLGSGAWAWSYRDTSSRGTSRFDIIIIGGISGRLPLRTGTWDISIKNTGTDTLSVSSYIADEATSWSGGVEFIQDATDEGTIDFPATADSAITVASYSTRGLDLEGIGLEAGGLSGFSSRGKRIDGVAIMDIAAPGNYDVFSAVSKDYEYLVYRNFPPQPGSYAAFGGTSAAGPHVAGVAALLLQAFPAAGHINIKEAIEQGARIDSFTGAVPNDSWGYGKLDAEGALQWLKENY